MAERTYRCLNHVITAKKRSWYRREDRWRVAINNRIIKKVPGDKLIVFITKLRARLYLANSKENKLYKEKAFTVGITMDFATWECTDLFPISRHKKYKSLDKGYQLRIGSM